MKKILSVFIDESGDFGFIKGASKYYLITLVFHKQSIDINSNIEKLGYLSYNLRFLLTLYDQMNLLFYVFFTNKS